MWESMENQRPAAWRVVFKGLTLLEHLLKNGSERCVDDARNHSHTLRSLHQFNYYEGTVDRGLGVREKSKQIVEILSDDERVREERQKARKLREKFGGNLGGVSGGGGNKYAGYGNDSTSGGGGYGDSGIDSSSYRTGGGGGGVDTVVIAVDIQGVMRMKETQHQLRRRHPPLRRFQKTSRKRPRVRS